MGIYYIKRVRLSFVYPSYILRICFGYHWFFVSLVERIFGSPPLGTKHPLKYNNPLPTLNILYSNLQATFTLPPQPPLKYNKPPPEKQSIVGRIRRPSALVYRNIFRINYCLGSWWFTNFCVFWNGGFWLGQFLLHSLPLRRNSLRLYLLRLRQ